MSLEYIELINLSTRRSQKEDGTVVEAAPQMMFRIGGCGCCTSLVTANKYHVDVAIKETEEWLEELKKLKEGLCRSS